MARPAPRHDGPRRRAGRSARRLHGTRAPTSCAERWWAGARCWRRARRRPRPPDSRRAMSAILNFALTLEELQAAFYTEVERNGVAARRAQAPGGHRRRPRARARARFRTVLGSRRSSDRTSTSAARPKAPTPSGAPRSRSRTSRSPPTRARRRTSPRARTSRRRWPSTRWRRATPRGYAGWPASRPWPARSTSHLARPATTRIVARTHFVMHKTSRKGPQFTG